MIKKTQIRRQNKKIKKKLLRKQQQFQNESLLSMLKIMMIGVIIIVVCEFFLNVTKFCIILEPVNSTFISKYILVQTLVDLTVVKRLIDPQV